MNKASFSANVIHQSIPSQRGGSVATYQCSCHTTVYYTLYVNNKHALFIWSSFYCTLVEDDSRQIVLHLFPNQRHSHPSLKFTPRRGSVSETITCMCTKSLYSLFIPLSEISAFSPFVSLFQFLFKWKRLHSSEMGIDIFGHIQGYL